MLDPSALKGASGCRRKLYLTVYKGYRSKKPTIDMEYGSAFHLFSKEVVKRRAKETTVEGKEQAFFISLGIAKDSLATMVPQCIFPKFKDHLTPAHLVATCFGFKRKYLDQEDGLKVVLAPDGTPLVELSFAYPWYSDNEIDVLMCGTPDYVGKTKSGSYLITDYKTTSSWNSKEFLESFRLDPQLMVYIMIFKKIAKDNPDSIFGELCKHPLGGRIHGVFTNSSKDTEFERSETYYYDDSKMEELEQLINETIENNLPYWKHDLLPLRQGMCNGFCKVGYGGKGCEFQAACQEPIGDDIFNRIMNNNYITVPYNPLTFGGQDKRSTELATQ